MARIPTKFYTQCDTCRTRVFESTEERKDIPGGYNVCNICFYAIRAYLRLENERHTALVLEDINEG